MVLLAYQKIKIFLQKVTPQISLKKFLWLKKLKILFPGLMLLMVLMKKNFFGNFDGKKLQKANQK